MFRCFHLLVVVISAALSMSVQISQDPMLISFEFIFRNGIDESCGSSIFNFLRRLYTVFCSSCTILKSIHNTQGSSFCTYLPRVVLSFPSYVNTDTCMNTFFYILSPYCLSRIMNIVPCATQ